MAGQAAVWFTSGDLMTLKIIDPITVTESMLIACDVPETDYAAYNAITTYALADRVIYEHGIWQSAQAGNVGFTPGDTASAAHWVFVSATNRHKCLDARRSSQTVKSGSMTYRIRPGQVANGLALLNIQADTVRVRVIDPVDGDLTDRTEALYGPVRRCSPHAWFFSRRIPKTRVLMLDLPPVYRADIEVTLTAASGDVALGLLVLGYVEELGLGVKYGLRLGLTDYSKNATDEWGNTVFKVLDYAETASLQFVLDNSELDETKDRLAALRGRPLIVICAEQYRSTAISCWIGEFEILIPYPLESDCSLDLKGLP